jgi:hypothetical protein
MRIVRACWLKLQKLSYDARNGKYCTGFLASGRRALDIPGFFLPEKFSVFGLGDPGRIGINFRVFGIVILAFLE